MTIGLLTAIPMLVNGAQRVQLYEAVKAREQLAKCPLMRYLTRDRFSRVVGFFTQPIVANAPAQPVLVLIQDSGASSVWQKSGTWTFAPYGQLIEEFRLRARVIIVEKPGVELGGIPSDQAAAGSDFFRAEHTLPRWTEAVAAAIKAAGEQPRTMLIGIGEGGQVAASLSGRAKNLVLVGTPSLSAPFDLRRKLGEAGEARWQQVLADKSNSESLLDGKSLAYWSSFGIPTTREDLRTFSGNFALLYGEKDEQVPLIHGEVLNSDLLAFGRKPEFKIFSGAGHDLDGNFYAIIKPYIDKFLSGK